MAIESIDDLMLKKRTASARLSALDKERNDLRNTISQCDLAIQQLQTPTIDVSDHAILRYCERVLGLDVDTIKKQIATEGLSKANSCLGDEKYPIGHDMHAVIKNNVVVSIVPS